MENVLVSACLLGINCKYNGGNNFCEKIVELKENYNLIPICPETLGGLESPRDPAEICGGKVLLKTGEDVTNEFNIGARLSLETAIKNNCKYAILKERSPSCGANYIYNGSFNGIVVDGLGITANILKENDISIFSEENIAEFLNIVKEKATR